MRLQSLRWILLLLLVVADLARPAGSGAAQQPPANAEEFHVFILAGQSNMAGRGTVEAQDRVVNPRVWMLDRDLHWVPASDPMHFDKPSAAVGPGRTFGIVLADANPDIHIGLVPTAVGGSSIRAWTPGAVHAETGAFPYDEALVRARAAASTGTLKGILWHQGESDSSPDAAREHPERLRELVERFRRDLGMPDLPFLIGQLGRFASALWSEGRVQIDSVHRLLATQLPDASFVSAEGLMDSGDGLHFNAEAARELGRRYAAAYLELSRRQVGR
jgi:hypothetical protein